MLVALGRAEEALVLLDPLTHESEASGYVDRLIPALAIQALALHALGRGEAALAALVRALALAEPEGYIRTFADMGDPMTSADHQPRRRSRRPTCGPRVPRYPADPAARPTQSPLLLRPSRR